MRSKANLWGSLWTDVDKPPQRSNKGKEIRGTPAPDLSIFYRFNILALAQHLVSARSCTLFPCFTD